MDQVSSVIWLVVSLWVLTGIIIGLHRLGLRYARTFLHLTIGGIATLNAWRPILLATHIAAYSTIPSSILSFLPITSRILGAVIYFTLLVTNAVGGSVQATLLAFSVLLITFVGGVLLPLFALVTGLLSAVPSMGTAGGILVVGLQQQLAHALAFVVGLFAAVTIYQLVSSRWPRRRWLLASGSALLIGGATETLLFTLGAYWQTPMWADVLRGEFLGWIAIWMILWPATAFYLRVLDRQGLLTGGLELGALDVVRDSLNLRTALAASERRLLSLSDSFHLIGGVRERILRVKNPEDLMQSTCDQLVEIHRYALAWIGRPEMDGYKVEPVACAGPERGYLESIEVTWDGSPAGNSPAGTAIRENRLEVIHDFGDGKGSDLWREEALGHGLKSAAAVPMRVDERVLGALSVYAREANVFDEDRLRALQAVANDLAHGLQRLEIEVLRAKRFRELETIRELTVEMISEHEVPNLLHAIVERATDLLNGSGGGMYLSDPEAEVVQCVVSYRTPQDYEGIILRYGEGAAGTVAQSGEPLIIEDYKSWSNRAEVFEEDASFHAIASAPMLWKGEVIGVIHVLRDVEDPPFNPGELDLLGLLANQAAGILENARLFEDAQQRAVQLARLNELTRTSIAADSMMELIETIRSKMGELIEADYSVVTLWDEDRKQVDFISSADSEVDSIRDLIMSVHDGSIGGQALRAGKALPLDGLSEVDGLSPAGSNPFQPQSALVLPLVVGEKWIGTAFLTFQNSHTFTTHEVEICEQAARQVALALANIQALERERRSIQELETLRQANLSVTSSLELQPVLTAILSHTLDLIDADDAHIFLYDGESLTFGAAKWTGEVQKPPFSEPRPGGLTYTVAQTGEQLVIGDVNRDPLFADWQWGGAIVGFPLQIGETLVGVMNVAYDHPHEFDEAELRVMELLADQAAIAIQNARLFENVDAERERVRLLYDMAQELATTLDPDEILQRAISLTVKSFEAWSGEAFLVDKRSERLVVGASSRSDGLTIDDLSERIDLRVGEGLMGWVPANLKSVIVSDVHQDERWVPIPGVDENVHSAVCTPIMAGDQLLGVMGVFDREIDTFQAEHLELLVAIGHQVGLALSNAGRYQEIERGLTELTLLRQVAQVVNRRLEMKPLLKEVVHQVGALLGFPVVEIYLVDEDELILGAARGGPMDESARMPLSEGLVGRVARTNQAAVVPDVLEDPDYLEAWPETRSEIAVPLEKEGVVIGVLNLESPEVGGLTQEDLRLLSLLADQLTVAVENAALYERVQQHADELEQIVDARTAELADALVQAQTADQLKTQFVSDVSHELRTPLSNIRLYLELLNQGRSERFEAYITTLNRETDRLVELIEDLLAISRLDAGTVTSEPALVNLNKIAMGLVDDRRRLLSDRQLDIDLSLDEGLPEVMVDERMLTQVIANLMTNAMNYTEGGGKVSIATEVENDSHGKVWATLTVSDTGLGVSSEEQERIFDRFYRGSASRQTGTPGTGLGLAICKEILYRHNGKITLQSRAKKGSAFTIWLPLDQREEQHQMPGSVNMDQERSKAR